MFYGLFFPFDFCVFLSIIFFNGKHKIFHFKYCKKLTVFGFIEDLVFRMNKKNSIDHRAIPKQFSRFSKNFQRRSNQTNKQTKIIIEQNEMKCQVFGIGMGKLSVKKPRTLKKLMIICYSFINLFS